MRRYNELSASEQREAVEQLFGEMMQPAMIPRYPARLRRALSQYADDHADITYDGLLHDNAERIRTALLPGIRAAVRGAFYAGPGEVIIRLRSESQPEAPATVAGVAPEQAPELAAAATAG